MKVLIVARTRRGAGACIGAISFDGQSLRLVAPSGADDRWGLEFDVGGVWEIDGIPPEYLLPPHVENLVVAYRRRLASMSDAIPFIERHMPPSCGGPELLFESALVRLPSSALCVEQARVPSCSTTFWRPDRPLVRNCDGKRIHYRYTLAGSISSLAYVGFQDSVAEIPAGSLVRVSIAHWWQPPDKPDVSLRCYVQLSGWFGPMPTTIATRAALPSPVSLPNSTAPLATMEQIRGLMKRVFGYESFRPLQEEVIAGVLNHRDSLGVMPTGAGKSLCFQLPALIPGGLTVVVSPLIALMQDQVDQLRTAGVCAVTLNSMMSHAEYVAATRQIRSGAARLLYVAPETLLRPEILLLMEECRVKLITIDEAHCISEWGHDFRPEYRQLRLVRDRFPDAVCLALTATATERVRADIRKTMGIAESDTYVAPFDRPNLHLEVRRRTGGIRQIVEFIRQHEGQSGIIYCNARKAVDLLSARLTERVISALPYHAGMEDDDRRTNQRRFIHDEVPIIVATTAFGMGINKSNIRYVIHHAMPDSLETYYQQIGRAGRDGLRADCLLLFARGDIGHAHHFIELGAESERPGKIARLGAMIRYAQAAACRRAALVTYFGDPAPQASCQMCDNCLAGESGRAAVDVSDDARLFLRCMDDIRQRFGLTYVVDVLRGSRSTKLLSRHHDKLTTYGLGSHRSKAWWRLMADRLVEQGIVEVDSEYGTARVTPAGQRVLGGDPFRAIMDEPKSYLTPGESGRTYDVLLFEALRHLRRQLATEASVPPYMVFSDRTLIEMAAERPRSPAEMLRIHGVGERKAQAYAPAFLGAIRAFVEQHAAEPDTGRVLEVETDDLEPRRCEESAHAFESGLSLDQIAWRWCIKRETVINHLNEYVREGGRLDPGRLLGECRLNEQVRNHALGVMQRLGLFQLGPVYQEMGGDAPYSDLRALQLYLLCGGTP